MRENGSKKNLHPRHWAAVMPDRPALIFGLSGTVVTYARLSDRADRCAHLMRSLDLRAGDTVAMLIENHPVFLEIAWAAQNAGLYFTPISWRFQIEEIAFILADCGARVLFVSEQQSHFLEGLNLAGMTALVAGSDPYEAALASMPAGPIADESRGSDMVYSSGSTGRPKGVKQKISGLAIDEVPRLFATYVETYGWGVETVYLMPAPLYHSGPLRFAMTMQHVGATLVVMERFDALRALEVCERYAVTNGHFVPTMLVRLLKLEKSERERYDISRMKSIVHGAGPCAPEVKRAALEWFGPILEESYGGTEGNGLTMISSAEWLEHPGSVGRPVVGSVHVIGEDGRELGPREQGLIYFAGGPKFEYHGNPEKTAEAYDSEGRSTLGDIGYVDEDGYVYLTDRKNHKVVTGGVNVFPQEIENVLITHDAVLDVAVFGLPDVEMGEVIQAVVQPREMARAGVELEAELIAFCRARLAHYKAPRKVDFRAELPRHDTGKIYTRLIKKEYLEKRN